MPTPLQVVSAPTGSGKTGVMELAVMRLLRQRLDPEGKQLTGRDDPGRAKAVYIAPLRALVQEKLNDWHSRCKVTKQKALFRTVGVIG